MKRIALIGLGVFSLIGLSLIGVACEAPDTGSRTFNSELPLNVYIVRTLDGDSEQIGATPSEAPLEIPKCRYWWVEPRGRVDMDKLSQEIVSKRVPGLRLRYTTDDDLAHVKILTGLQRLDLSDTTITDAGMITFDGWLLWPDGGWICLPQAAYNHRGPCGSGSLILIHIGAGIRAGQLSQSTMAMQMRSCRICGMDIRTECRRPWEEWHCHHVGVWA